MTTRHNADQTPHAPHRPPTTKLKLAICSAQSQHV
jgi:hypothetical protein